MGGPEKYWVGWRKVKGINLNQCERNWRRGPRWRKTEKEEEEGIKKEVVRRKREWSAFDQV